MNTDWMPTSRIEWLSMDGNSARNNSGGCKAALYGRPIVLNVNRTCFMWDNLWNGGQFD
jgi:hypothetical protein